MSGTWNVEKGVGALLVWGYGMEKFPLYYGYVLEDVIVSARARRQKKDLYAVVSLVCFEVGIARSNVVFSAYSC